MSPSFGSNPEDLPNRGSHGYGSKLKQLVVTHDRAPRNTPAATARSAGDRQPGQSGGSVGFASGPAAATQKNTVGYRQTAIMPVLFEVVPHDFRS